MIIKPKICKGTGKAIAFKGCGVPQVYRKYGLGTLCGCFYRFFESYNPRKIKPMSAKRILENRAYLKLRKKFLEENTICFIEGCNEKANTVEHSAGRGSNYLKVETWKPCCLAHNLELENNYKLAQKYQLSKIHGGKKMAKI